MTTGYYIESFLKPLAPWLAAENVTDIYINRPGELWVESLGGEIVCYKDESLTDKLLSRLTQQIAALSSQGISRRKPLLSATLPGGSRIQVAGPPATREGYSFSIRRHISSHLSLDDLEAGDAFAELQEGEGRFDSERQYRKVLAGEAAQFLKHAVAKKRNMLISGGTSTGKTTFLNALLKEVPDNERLILIEDTAELDLTHKNSVGLIAARGDLRV